MSTTYGSTKTISLVYNGYWREQNVGGVPDASGVYSVYACTYNRGTDTVSIRELIYIGESALVRSRIRQHLGGPSGASWRRRLRPGEELCFAFAPIGSSDRERAEAALVYKHKPPANIQYIDYFPTAWSPTTVWTSGTSALLASHFRVP